MSNYTFGTLDPRRLTDAEFERWLSDVRAEAWDEGYSRGSLDGYFETREEKNPHRPEEP